MTANIPKRRIGYNQDAYGEINTYNLGGVGMCFHVCLYKQYILNRTCRPTRL
jgi:hypothetical protein